MAYISFQPSDYYNTVLYTGNNTDPHTITGVGFSGDLTWIKDRSAVQNHYLFDTPRGATYQLITNNNQSAGAEAQSLKSWNSDGFVVGTKGEVNDDANTFVAWSWKAGTTSGITTNGSTTITPSAYSFNATAGFSVLKYTGVGDAGDKIAHGLGVTPNMIIVKCTSHTGNWAVYHQGVDATAPQDYLMKLDTNAVRSDNNTYWNDTAPDTVNFTVGVEGDVNLVSRTYIAYCFAEKKGYSKFGSYIGNGNADGTFIYTGFRPAFFMLKSATAVENWYMMDDKRLGYNDANRFLFPDETAVEIAKTNSLLSNGVKMGTADGSTNGSGQTFIYAAFAEFPLVSSNNIPTTAR